MNTANIAVFVMFFGIAFFEALQGGRWLEAALFILLGLLSLKADLSKKR